MSVRTTLTAAWLIAFCSVVATAADQIPWASDFAQACQQANAQGKLVLLHFYSDDCPPCVRVEKNVFSQPEVGAIVGQHYVPVKVHARKEAALANKYHVQQWPTDVFVKPDGSEVIRTVSPQSPADYMRLVSSVAAAAGPKAATNTNTAATNPPASTPGAPSTPYAAAAAAPGAWITSASKDAVAQFNNQANAQAAWMTSSAAATAQQAQQSGQQAWQYAQNQTNQAVANTNQAAQQMQQQASQVAQQTAASAQAAAGQAQEVVNRYAQPWTPPGGNWQSPAAAASVPPAAAPNVAAAPPAFAPPAFTPPTQTAPPANVSAASPYETNPALAPVQPAAATGNYPVAMGGFCPVSLAVERKWKKGQPQFGAVHRRRTFLFASAAEQQKFLQDPDRYSPVLVGYDPVKFMQTGELVDGSANYSLTYRKQVYLFTDDASLKSFWQNPSQFTEGLRQAMTRTEANRTIR